MIDASDQDLSFIKKTILKYIPDCEIRVFGSRIKGTSRKYSDIDIAIVSNNQIEWLLIEKIKDIFAESDLLYRIDLHDYNTMSENFKKVVNQAYEVI